MSKRKTGAAPADETIHERQERERREKLDALIATVETRPIGRFAGRLPRKIGEIICETGLRDGYREQRAHFVLRMDVVKGEFIAEHGDRLYVARTKEALQAKMDQVAKVELDLVWTRYLVIRYVAQSNREKHSRWSDGAELATDDKRRKKERVHGLSLRWNIVEISSEYSLPGGEPKRLCRDLKDDKPSTSTETIKTLPDGAIEYTPERLALLESIVAAFTQLDAKMVELLRGDADAVAARLDAIVGNQFLLASGAADAGE